MGCRSSCMSDDRTCSTPFGSFKLGHCGASCSQEQEEEMRVAAVKVEEMVDAMMKKWIEEKLHPALQQHMPAALAAHIESTMLAVVNVDLIPRCASAPASQVVSPATTIRRLDCASSTPGCIDLEL